MFLPLKSEHQQEQQPTKWKNPGDKPRFFFC